MSWWSIRRSFLVVLAVLILASCACAVENPEQPSAASSAEVDNPGYPVQVDGNELLRVFQSVGSFTAEERAKAISQRLQRLVSDRSADLNQLRVVKSEYGSSIDFGDNVLMVVTDADARSMHSSPDTIAAYYLKQMRQGVLQGREQHSRKYLIWAGIKALITLCIYLLILWVIVAGFRWLLKILKPAAATLGSIKIQQTELLEGQRIATFLGGCIRVLRVILIFALTWVFLATEFNYFPWTRQHGKRLLEYITTPVRFVVSAFVNYLPNLFYILVIVTMMVYVMKFVRLLAREVERGNIKIPGFYLEWVQPTYKIIRFLLIAFTAVVIFPYMPGENSPAFKGIGLFIGVLFSLGSTSAVANVIAGVIIIYARGFRVTDWVKIGDNTGEITALTMLATHLQTIRNEEVIIPNSVVLNNYVTNYSMLARTQGLILHTSVTIGYEAPWRQIHGLLIDAALKTKHILHEPAPFVLQNALQDSYVQYEINAYTDQPKQMVYIYSELHGYIQDCFYAAGVEIMSPIYSAIRDGNRTQIPDAFLPADYKPQGFRIAKEDAAAAASGKKI